MDIELKKFEQLKATGTLPSPKGVALSIVRLAQREDVGTAQLEQVIKSDPAFVGRLLKTANITARDCGRPVASVPDAMNVLGIVVVRNLALGFSLVSGYRSGACRHFDYNAFWTRAVVNALALQAVVRATRVANPEEAFCCGLLAEIGKLALATLHPLEYSRVIDEARAEVRQEADAGVALLPEKINALLRMREEAAFALHHDDLTAAMLSDWGFPRALIEPLFFRHSPELAGFVAHGRSERMLHAVRLADTLTDLCLTEAKDRGQWLGRLRERAQALEIDPASLEGMIDGIVRDWREWAVMLSVKSPPEAPSFSDMLAEETPEPSGAQAAKTAAGRTGEGGVDEAAGAVCLRVLLAGGDAGERAALRATLRAQGHAVFEAADGQHALDLALTAQPHVLIADRALHGLDAVQLTRALRQTRIGRGMYVLILTGGEDEGALVEAFDAGADDYLAKPVRDRLLLARLRAAKRVVDLQEEVLRDHEEMKHFAAELAVSNRRLHEASVTDPLTGFHNRRYAMDRLEKEWAASSRNGRPLSCLMIDLDNFKTINDTYGHDVGDQVLVAAAGVLRRALRANDVICRVGGDEFLVISSDTDAASIRACAERLLAAADRVVVESPRGLVRCGISIGVATRDDSMNDTAMLIKAADVGMYQAKVGGRARIGERFD